MKLKTLGLPVFVLSLFSYTKEQLPARKTYVKVKLDYIGNEGYYNDNIRGVPPGLVVGTNGPFVIDATQQYQLQHKASALFPEISMDWKPAEGKNYVIHTWVSDNHEYLEVKIE